MDVNKIKQEKFIFPIEIVNGFTYNNINRNVSNYVMYSFSLCKCILYIERFILKIYSRTVKSIIDLGNSALTNI